jgi:hypothetical protein
MMKKTNPNAGKKLNGKKEEKIIRKLATGKIRIIYLKTTDRK